MVMASQDRRFEVDLEKFYVEFPAARELTGEPFRKFVEDKWIRDQEELFEEFGSTVDQPEIYIETVTPDEEQAQGS